MKHSGARSTLRRGLLVALSIGLLGLWGPFKTEAANKDQAPVAKADTPSKTRITADRMISEGQKHFVEFIGTVKVVQDNTIITSDRLKIFYRKKEQNDTTTRLAGNHAITRMIATGNVVIRLENGIAHTKTAEYDMTTQLVTLTGPDSTFTSGESSLSGSKIVFHREKGNIKAEGGNRKQVEVVFSSTESTDQ